MERNRKKIFEEYLMDPERSDFPPFEMTEEERELLQAHRELDRRLKEDLGGLTPTVEASFAPEDRFRDSLLSALRREREEGRGPVLSEARENGENPPSETEGRSVPAKEKGRVLRGPWRWGRGAPLFYSALAALIVAIPLFVVTLIYQKGERESTVALGEKRLEQKREPAPSSGASPDLSLSGSPSVSSDERREARKEESKNGGGAVAMRSGAAPKAEKERRPMVAMGNDDRVSEGPSSLFDKADEEKADEVATDEPIPAAEEAEASESRKGDSVAMASPAPPSEIQAPSAASLGVGSYDAGTAPGAPLRKEKSSMKKRSEASPSGSPVLREDHTGSEERELLEKIGTTSSTGDLRNQLPLLRNLELLYKRKNESAKEKRVKRVRIRLLSFVKEEISPEKSESSKKAKSESSADSEQAQKDLSIRSEREQVLRREIRKLAESLKRELPQD